MRRERHQKIAAECILTPRIPGYWVTSILITDGLLLLQHNNLYISKLGKEAHQQRSPTQTQTSDLPELCQYLEISCVFRMKDRLETPL